MDGIDKLVLSVPHVISSGETIGYPLSAVKRIAYRNGLEHRPLYVASENRIYTAFTERDTGERIEGLFLRHFGYGRDSMVKHVALTPTRFSSHGSMSDVLNRIGQPWLPDCRVDRIDFAVDYNGIDFGTFSAGVDIDSRTCGQVWFGTRSGLPETHYFGAAKDIVLIYDKTREREARGRPFPENSPPRVRVERQLQSRAKVASAFGEDVTVRNLLRHLRTIANGHLPILGAVNAATIAYRPDNELTTSQIKRRCYMEGVVAMGSYALARRYIDSTENRNFSRYRPCYDRTPFPEHEQPDAILQRALTEFLRDAPRRRTLPPQVLARARAA